MESNCFEQIPTYCMQKDTLPSLLESLIYSDIIVGCHLVLFSAPDTQTHPLLADGMQDGKGSRMGEGCCWQTLTVPLPSAAFIRGHLHALCRLQIAIA